MKKEPADQYHTSASATLIVKEILKGPFAVSELPIEIAYGLSPSVGGEIRYIGQRTGAGYPDENVADGEIKIFDTGNSSISVDPITGDLNKNQIWLFRVRYDGSGSASGKLRIWDPEDIQPVSKKNALAELIGLEPDAASERENKKVGNSSAIHLSISDYVIQGFIVLLIFVHPWFLHPGQGSRAFCYPFLAIFVWGFWRMFYFDSATNNDIPGIGYFIVALPYSLIALLFFAIRCAILRRRTKSQ